MRKFYQLIESINKIKKEFRFFLTTNLKNIVFIFILSVTSFSSWIFEINHVIGWYDTNWLYTFHYSPFIISFLIALSFLSPLWINTKNKRKKSVNYIIALILLYGINWSFYFICSQTYEFAEAAFYMAAFCGKILFYPVIFLLISFMWAVGVLIGTISYKTILEKLKIASITKKEFKIFYLLILLVMPLSDLLLLLSGFDKFFWVELQAETVKTGLPIFWVSMMLGIFSLYYSRKR